MANRSRSTATDLIPGWDLTPELASGRLDPSPLYTHAYPLERLDEALDATRDRPDGFLKALVTL